MIEDRLKEISLSAKVLWSKQFLFGYLAYEEEQEIIRKYSKFLAKNSNIGINSGYTEVFTKDVLKKDTTLGKNF